MLLLALAAPGLSKVNLELTRTPVASWSLHDPKTDKYYEAWVPSCTLLDLMNHSLIPDYFSDDNYKEMSSGL
jgi:beta-mannosidase